MALTDQTFHALADALLARLEAAVEAADTELDFDLIADILTLTAPDGSKIIINRQTPNREIWVAAKSGGFHFRFASVGWVDTRSGETLCSLLSKLVSQQAGGQILISLD